MYTWLLVWVCLLLVQRTGLLLLIERGRLLLTMKERSGLLLLLVGKIRNTEKYASLLQCDLCGRGFPLGSLLERHVRTHTLANRITCPYCGKSYGSKATYNYHMFSKHSGKPVMEIRHIYVENFLVVNYCSTHEIGVSKGLINTY